MEKNNFFVKSHGLGNDYIVLDEANLSFELDAHLIRIICDYHYGIGSDGILLKVPSIRADFGLRIFNPDASEAEKSGNGLRIFSKYLYDYGIAQKKTFTIDTPGGVVHSSIIEDFNGKASMVSVDMGKAIFSSSLIPVKTDKSTFINEPLMIFNKEYHVNCVSVGNPHCVIIKENLDIDEIKKYGPYIESNHIFPNKINVQFAKVLNDHEAEIIIWERGVGYTLASGSSASAVASVLHKLGLVCPNVDIHMKGGVLKINIDDVFNITMTGPVKQIAEGFLSSELFS